MGVTKIEWSTYTFNPWRGCRKIHTGCKNCYAETRAGRCGEEFAKQRVRLSDAGWNEPLKWDREAASATVVGRGKPRVFCASLADVFEDWDGPIVDHRGDTLMICECGNRDGAPWETPPQTIECSAECGITRNDMVEDQFNNLETGWPDPHVEHNIHGYLENYQGADCRIRLRDKKGGNPDEWPEDLRVREIAR